MKHIEVTLDASEPPVEAAIEMLREPFDSITITIKTPADYTHEFLGPQDPRFLVGSALVGLGSIFGYALGAGAEVRPVLLSGDPAVRLRAWLTILQELRAREQREAAYQMREGPRG